MGYGRGLVAFTGLCLGVSLGLPGCGEGRDEARPAESPIEHAPIAETEASDGKDERPLNVVLITLDTTRADALGTYGQALPTTPNLDRLAETGVVFEQAMTSSPATLPSHATIFTGLQPFAHGVRANAGYVLADRHTTLAEVLAKHGYRTGAEIAAAVLSAESRIAQGFEHRRDASSPGVQLVSLTFAPNTPDQKIVTKPIRLGSDITRRGIEFIERNRGEPFFLWLHYFDPHSPYKAPSEFNAEIPSSPYHAEVASADHEVGRIVERIEDLGLRERTLVIVTADHGEGLGDHGEATHSFFVYDSTMRVPLIFWGLEGRLESRRVESLARTVDIAPTVLELLELPGLANAQGASLAAQLTGRPGGPSVAYGESSMRFYGIFGIPPLRTLREGRWKYIHKVSPELYDVVADPGELTNRIADKPEEAERLRARLEAMIRDAPPPPEDAIAPLDSRIAAQLAALGYVASAPENAAEHELALLDLSGDDPVSKASDVQILAIAAGLVQRQAYEQALPDLRKLAERNPDRPVVLSLFAQALAGLERYDEALPVFRQLHEFGAATPNETAKLANLLARRGETDEAIELYTGLLSEEPCHEEALSDLNVVYRTTSRFDALVEVLAHAARVCPDIASILNGYAWALATLPREDLRNGALAVEVARAALAASGTDDPGTLDTLAAALAETGDFEQAVQVQSGAIRQLEKARAPKAMIAAFEDHLETFEASRPIRDP
jgi:arylsulfatase A-like enzyme/Flp pilus assembly protein TadD